MQATPIINYKEASEALVLKYDDVMQELAVLKKMGIILMGCMAPSKAHLVSVKYCLEQAFVLYLT